MTAARRLWTLHIPRARTKLNQWWISFRRTGLDRALIVLKSFGVMLAFFYPVWWLHVNVVSRRVAAIPLSLAIAFIAVQAASICAQLMASSLVKKVGSMRAARSARFRPLIQQALAAYLSADSGALAQLRSLRRRSCKDLEVCLVEALTAVDGHTRRQLSDLAVELGLRDLWTRRARRGRRECKQAVESLGQLSPGMACSALRPLLNNPKMEREPIVYRALVRCAGKDELNLLFRKATGASLSLRAMLAGELRGYAPQLTAVALPAILKDGTTSQIANALELAAAWRCPLPLAALAPLMSHSNSQVRANALTLSEFSGLNQGGELLVLKSLDDPDPGVQTVAIGLAGRFRLTSAVGRLVSLKRHSDSEMSRAASLALAMLGPTGQAFLQSDILTSDPRSAGRAAESLASIRTSHPSYLEVA